MRYLGIVADLEPKSNLLSVQSKSPRLSPMPPLTPLA